MWKPGTARPEPHNAPETPKQDAISANGTPKSAQSSSKKKRLSGATLNMRFMKRTKETPSSEKQSKSKTSERETPTNNSTSTQYNNNVANRDDDMEIDNDQGPDTTAPFSRATPADMYGIQGTLIGRRSFGGFNRAMEDAWRDCKASLENDRSAEQRHKAKISDEELLKRYKDIADHRKGDNHRPVGNLKRKKSPKRQRR